MGSSGAGRGCPTRDSEGGESSLSGRFSAFAVGSDCISILAARIDMVVTCAIMRPGGPVGQSGGVVTTRSRASDAEGERKSGRSRKGIKIECVP